MFLCVYEGWDLRMWGRLTKSVWISCFSIVCQIPSVSVALFNNLYLPPVFHAASHSSLIWQRTQVEATKTASLCKLNSDWRSSSSIAHSHTDVAVNPLMSTWIWKKIWGKLHQPASWLLIVLLQHTHGPFILPQASQKWTDVRFHLLWDTDKPASWLSHRCFTQGILFQDFQMLFCVNTTGDAQHLGEAMSHLSALKIVCTNYF